MLEGCVKSVSDTPFPSTLQNSIEPLFERVWPHLCNVLKQRSFDTEICDSVCQLLAEIFEALEEGLIKYFQPVESELMQAFAVNPKNFECLKKVALLMGILGKKDQNIR